MATNGLSDFHDGLGLKLNYGSTNKMKLDIIAEPTATWTLKLPNNPPASNSTWSIDSSGNVTYAAVAGGGYKGTANGAAATAAAALTPANASLQNGDTYRVTAAGSTAFGYQVDVGDYVVYNGTTFDKQDLTNVANVAKGSFTSATLVSGSLTITHSLNNQRPDFKIYNENNEWIIPDKATGTSLTVFTVDLTSYNTPTAITGTWNYTLVG